MVSDDAFRNHTVFDDLARYGAFYKNLSESVFTFVSVGTRAICNIDTYLYSAIHGTLASIRSVLRDGRINDAYALLRKFHDSAIINIYADLYLEDHVRSGDFIVTQIDRWLQGKDKLPEFRIMSQYIRSSQTVAPISAILYSDDYYKHLRDRCNDHTHYNFYRNVLLNDNEIYLKDRGIALQGFSDDLRDLVILHLSFMFFANGHYMMSRDHLDWIEFGMTPEPDSEYWVAPFVQEIFDQTIAAFRPDVAAIIKQHSSMHLA